MVQYYTYILKLIRNSKKNAGKVTYYTGVTDNPVHRLSEIRNGIGCEWIRRNMLSPVGFVYMESFEFAFEADKRKKQLKRLSLKDKEDLINGKISTTIHCD